MFRTIGLYRLQGEKGENLVSPFEGSCVTFQGMRQPVFVAGFSGWKSGSLSLFSRIL